MSRPQTAEDLVVFSVKEGYAGKFSEPEDFRRYSSCFADESTLLMTGQPPKKSNGRDNMAYDFSDSAQLDSGTGQDVNSERDWFSRLRTTSISSTVEQLAVNQVRS
ncbi:hypothetical protein PABG_12488 [Paracoccidioides brasiliensis Pb03]|nr:hypothetical protein PABG_12488 [Paracoccidioides brasiliensis Pb03]